jgi:hypothetical protein
MTPSLKNHMHKLLLKGGVFLSVTFNFFMITTFYVAYVSGGRVMISVNSFGEGLLEGAIVIPAIGGVLVWTLYNIVREG